MFRKSTEEQVSSFKDSKKLRNFSYSAEILKLSKHLNFDPSHGVQMPKDLTWDDAQDIGILLSEKHPNTDPLTVRYTDLHRYVTELADFKDDPKKSSEGKLEAIQMAWHEEYEERG